MTTPRGFAPVFKGWNVWAVLAQQELSFSPMMVGVDDDRRLRIWVEEQASAPGVAIADDWNPGALKGSQVEIIQSAEGLDAAAERAQEFPASLLNWGPNYRRVFVRFYNRGESAVTTWPHDEDFYLDTAYQPEADNAITGGPPPSSLAGAASAAVEGVGSTLKVVAIVGGAVLVVGGLAWLLSRQRSMAA